MDKREGPISKYIPLWVQDLLTVAGWTLTGIVAITYIISSLD